MAYCRDSLGRTYYCNSPWDSWGRWVLLAIIIFGGFFIFLLFSCITARKRRKLGRKPMYGTGWAAAGPWAGNQGQGQASYNPNYNSQPAPGYNQQSAPQYNNYNSAPQGGYGQTQGGYGGQNSSYYSGQQTGVEVPGNTYQPPSGPPPNKYT